jgi:WD40 repeat protein
MHRAMSHDMWYRRVPSNRAILLLMAITLASCASAPENSIVPLAPTPSQTLPETFRPTREAAPTMPLPPTELPSATTTEASIFGPKLLRETNIDLPRQMAWSPDGKTIAVSTMNGIALVDAASLTQVAYRETEIGQNHIAVSPDGGTIATADYWEEGLYYRRWTAKDLNLVGRYDLPDDPDLPGDEEREQVAELAFLQSGELLLACQSLMGVDVWSSEQSGQLTHNFLIRGGFGMSATISSATGLVAAELSPGYEDVVEAWSSETMTLYKEIPITGNVSLLFSRQGNTLLVTDWQATVWDLSSMRSVSAAPVWGPIVEGNGLPSGQSFSLDDRYFAGGTEIPARGIAIWETQTGQLAGLLPHEALAQIIDIDFSPANDELAILTYDGRLEIWSVPP